MSLEMETYCNCTDCNGNRQSGMCYADVKKPNKPPTTIRYRKKSNPDTNQLSK